MRLLLVLTASLVMSGAAQACIVGANIFKEYYRMTQANLDFVAVKGHFQFDLGLPKKTADRHARFSTGRLTGVTLDGEPYDEKVTWYDEPLLFDSSPRPDHPAVAFVSMTEVGPMITIGFCGGGYIYESEEGIEQLAVCHRSGTCPEY